MKKFPYLAALVLAAFALAFAPQVSEAAKQITEARAKTIALKHAKISQEEAHFTKIKLEREHGRAEYELEFYAHDRKYEYDIDANTGDVIKFSHEKKHGAPHKNSPGGAPDGKHGRIDEARARRIALDRVPGARDEDIVKFKRDHDHGREIYEGKIIHKGKKYEFEIDAENGEIREWKIDG